MKGTTAFFAFVLGVALALGASASAAESERKIRVACIGDSITWGYAMTNRVAECYPAQLQRLLGPKYEVRNFGDPGSCVYSQPRRLPTGWIPHTWRTGGSGPAAYAFEPDIVVSNLGINDSGNYLDEFVRDGNGRPKAEQGLFRREYVDLLQAFGKNGRKPRIILWSRLGPLGKRHGLKGTPGPFVMETDLQAVARAVGAETLDMYTPLLPYAETLHFAADGIHPEGGAQRVIAEVTARCILGTTEPCPVDENLSVLISDIHLQTVPTNAYAFTAREFPKRVDEILAMRPRPRRVICFGDLVFDHGEPASYAFLRKEVDRLERAGVKVVLGMGNHDRRQAFLAEFPEAGKNQPVPGRIVYKVDLGHCDLILLDTLDGAEQKVGGEIGPEQEAWLRREVASAKRPLILGAHHEIYRLTVGERPLFEFMRGSDKVVGWINGHGHWWCKENLCWGPGPNEDVIRALMLPTGGAWGEIGLTTLRTYPDRAEATLRMIDMVWHDALRPGEKRPKVYDAIVADQDGERIVFPYERPMLRGRPNDG